MRAEGRFYLDPGGWAHHRPRDDRHLKTVARAVWNDRRLEVSYRRPTGKAARRTLDPLGLVHKTGVWYLVAIHDGVTRVYRVDRILAARETETASCRPDDFDLATFWENWETEYAASLPVFSARVRLGPLAQRHRSDLGGLSPRGVAEDPPDNDGWVTQTLLFDDRRVAIAALLALAPEVEIIAPDDLRHDLVVTAQETIARLTVGAAEQR
jgi:predicted DNA-binding transcriptional regulator YafY